MAQPPMSRSPLILRLLLSFALIANGVVTPAAIAMTLGTHGAAATGQQASTQDAHAGHHCHDSVAPGKTPSKPPCCGGGKCQCGCITVSAMTVVALAPMPQSHPELSPHTEPVAAATPAPAELLRPPIA